MNELIENKVEEGVLNLFKILNTERPLKNNLIVTSLPVFLQIDFVKIPKIYRRVVRIPLQHSLCTNTSDVCLIVADLIRGRRVNHEMTVNHYKKLLKKRGVTDIQNLQVIPSRQIRTEYNQFEARQKLCNMYDVFLIDNKISSYLRSKLGKPFQKARKWPIPIRIKRKNLKDEILSKLKKSSMALDGKGTTKCIQIGHTDMSETQITENLLAIKEYISKYFPGGWTNIRSLHIKGPKTVAIPIYLSLISSNDVPTPVIKMKRKRKLTTGVLSTIGKKVTVYANGKIKIHNERSEDESDNDITENVRPKIAKVDKKSSKLSESASINSKKKSDVEINYLYQIEMQKVLEEKKDRKKAKKKKDSS